MKINDNEQWKLEGKCSICRRNTYCKSTSTCAASKRRQYLIIDEAIQEVFTNGFSQTEDKY